MYFRPSKCPNYLSYVLRTPLLVQNTEEIFIIIIIMNSEFLRGLVFKSHESLLK